MIELYETESGAYVAKGQAIRMSRFQNLKTPNGNKLNGRWGLIKDGKLIDFDQYRNDLAERNDIKLVSIIQEMKINRS